MPDDFLDLYNLSIEGPFSAARIPGIGNPAQGGCDLPADNPVVIDLPFDDTLPPLECDFNIDIPIVPPPYICPPTVSGEVTITSSNESVGVIETTAIAIIRTEDTECDFSLVGNIDLTTCVLTAGGGVSITSEDESITVDVITPISIVLVEDTECDYVLSGSINLSGGGCFPQYLAVLEPIHYNMCHEADQWTLRVCTSCEEYCVYTDPMHDDECLELTPVEGCFERTVSAGTYYVRIVCCDGAHIIKLKAPTPSGSCPTTDVVVDVDTDVSAECTGDPLHLDLETSTEDDITTYTVKLHGRVPGAAACYTCDGENDGLQSIELNSLDTTEIRFLNDCCENTYAGWTVCGNTLAVGDSGSNSVLLTADGASTGINIAGDSATIDLAVAALTGTNREASFRELTLCIDGSLKRFWVLATEPEDLP